jgi:hypothetical protein
METSPPCAQTGTPLPLYLLTTFPPENIERESRVSAKKFEAGDLHGDFETYGFFSSLRSRVQTTASPVGVGPLSHGAELESGEQPRPLNPLPRDSEPAGGDRSPRP